MKFSAEEEKKKKNKNKKINNHFQIGKLFLDVGVGRKIRVALKIRQGVGGNVCRGESRVLYP